MLKIQTSVKSSPIHGKGLFTKEYVNKGQLVWIKTNEDVSIPMDVIPNSLRDYFDKYATVSKYGNIHVYQIDGDDCKFMNHSYSPNVIFIDNIALATRDIDLNEELLCDYTQITTPEHFEYLMSLSNE
jgi:SET domain-containing protein